MKYDTCRMPVFDACSPCNWPCIVFISAALVQHQHLSRPCISPVLTPLRIPSTALYAVLRQRSRRPPTAGYSAKMGTNSSGSNPPGVPQCIVRGAHAAFR